MLIIAYPLPNVKKTDLKGMLTIMDQSENILSGMKLGYLNSKYEVTRSGMQALAINSCAADMPMGYEPIDILNNYASVCYNRTSKAGYKEPVTLADFRNIIYNIVLGVFPAYPDESIYCICADALIALITENNHLNFSKPPKDLVPVLRTQIEHKQKEMEKLKGSFDNLVKIIRKGYGCPFVLIYNFYEYFELFCDIQDERLRSSFLYDMGYIAGKRDERARRKKSAG